jgi:hypothetical protein
MRSMPSHTAISLRLPWKLSLSWIGAAGAAAYRILRAENLLLPVSCQRRCYARCVFARLRQDVRTSPASWAWLAAHVAALLILTVITGMRGVWWWTLGPVLAVSCYVGQVALNRHARRATDADEDGTGPHLPCVPGEPD